MGDSLRNLGILPLTRRSISINKNRIQWSSENGVFIESDELDGTPDGKSFAFGYNNIDPLKMDYTAGSFVKLTKYKENWHTGTTSQILYGSGGATGTTGKYNIRIRNSNNLHPYGIQNYNSSTYYFTNYDEVPLNTWFHVCISSNGRFYVNGQYVGTNTNPPVNTNSDRVTHYLGGAGTSSTCLRDAYFSNFFAVNEGILSDSEILELYNLGYTPFYG